MLTIQPPLLLLEFTPLEFETMYHLHIYFLFFPLEFTPLEFETSNNPSVKDDGQMIRIYSVGV